MVGEKPLRVLLVEDNPGDARFIRETLRDATDQSLDRGRRLSGREFSTDAPPELTHESELESGLRRLDEAEPDIVFLDLDLPDSRGLETLSSVLDLTETVPVVVLTGLRDRETGMEALRLGAEEYLVKDEITPDLLIRSTYHAIERKVREREQKRYEILIEESTDVNAIIGPDRSIRYLTPSVEHVLGYSSDELVGENVLEYVHPEDRDGLKTAFTELIENDDSRLTTECRFEHADGSWVVLHVRGRNLLDDPTIDGIVVYTRDITERRTYERRLEVLNEANQELNRAENTAEVARNGLEASDRTLGVDVGCVRLFEAEANALEPVAMTDEAEALLASRPAFDLEKTLAGRAYRQGEVVHNRRDADAFGEMPVGESLHLPLGEHGVLTLILPEDECFDDLEVVIAEALANGVRAALGRADREETLRANERELRQQHEELDTLHRITTLVQEVGDHLIETTTRADLEQAICDRVAASELFQGAWIGAIEPTHDGVEVRVGAGLDDTHLEALDGLPLDRLGNGTVKQALETGELQVVRQYQAGDSAPDGGAAEPEGRVEATAAIPLAYGDRVHGVLVVNGRREDVFTENALAGFESLGRLAGFAFTALRTREILLSDAVVELELTVADPTLFYSVITAELDCRCRLNRSVPIAEGKQLNYHLVEGADPARVLEAAADVDHIEDAEVVSERDGAFVLQTVTDVSLSQLALQAGASVGSAVVEDGEARVTLEAPRSVDIREVVEVFDERLSDVELVAKRERERAVQTATEFREHVEEQLTEKQRAVFEAAYAGGYFEWPREITAEELAESMGVSSSTLHQHLRHALASLAAAFFEGSQPTGATE